MINYFFFVFFFEVAYWSFPQDVNRVRAHAYLTENLTSWRRAISLVKEDKIKEMWQVGESFLDHVGLSLRATYLT